MEHLHSGILQDTFSRYKGAILMFLTDFSLESWLLSKGYSDSIDLPNYVVSELLHDLDIAPFLNDISCNRRSVPFYPNTDGWNKGEIINI